MTGRYTIIAPAYDVLSGEWPVYGVGRRIGIPMLRLRPGATVLDVGCGTGLNLPILADAVGAAGVVVGVDASAQMLAAARRRHHHRGGPNPALRLWRRDATDLSHLDDEEPALVDGADAVLFTYSLSLMRPWQNAWASATALARPGARVLVVDMALPTGPARALAPLARLACRLGGAEITAHPWQALERECDDVVHRTARGGHVQVWAGTLRRSRRPGGPEHPHDHLLTGEPAPAIISPDGI